MGKRERSKENKFKIKIWLPILCIVVVGATFYMINDIENKIEEANQLKKQEIADNEQNTFHNENITNENTIENSVVQNEVTNQLHNMTTSNTTNTIKNNTVSNAGVTDLKQKAIELVQKEWGTDNSVDFLFDSVNEKGEYVIAVKDREAATVKFYFRVNLETGTVELD